MAASSVSGPIDSHCHLQYLDTDDCQRALDVAREAGVSGFLVPAVTLDDSERLLELSARESDVWCALGVHPHEASTWRPGDRGRLLALVNEPRVVAVGECGLDFHYDRSPRRVQIETMRAQWEIAVEASMPVIIHNRDSSEVMLQLLSQEEFADLRGVFHSFAGGREMAAEILDGGFFIGMSGMITFSGADNVREVLPVSPRNRLLVETDSPYLAPVPHRGKPNQPAYVVEVVKRLAEEMVLSTKEVSALTTTNFFSLFTKAISVS